MVQLFHEGGVRLADGQTRPAAACLPTQNSHQDCQGKKRMQSEEVFVGNKNRFRRILMYKKSKN